MGDLSTDPLVHDLVIAGGRVIDPETGHDAVADVGIVGGRIAEIAVGPLRGRSVISAAGKVVAPGHIDLHSHSHTLAGHRLQACDGVTTVLELEAGLSSVERAYARADAEGRLLNYGFSASWAASRMEVVAGFEVDSMEETSARLGDAPWQVPASAAQLAALGDRVERDLAAGALGIGMLVGYAPEVDPAEYVAMAALAARVGAPTYTHARDLVEHNRDVRIDGAEEIVRAAAETGCHMHYCHVNSTSRHHVDRVLVLVERVRAEGSRVSTEAYPYGAGMTAIGAVFLAPERLAGMGLTARDIVHAGSGERMRDDDRLREVRTAEPGAGAFVHFLDEGRAADQAVLDRAFLEPGTAVGSDAMPVLWDGPASDLDAWPLPEGAITHPRTAGSFSRVLRRHVREVGALGLSEALARCSLEAARILEDSVPAMRRKGRVQVGCDADLIVFDPETVSDRATYAHSTLPSTGYSHVLVGGVPVVAEGVLRLDARPGRAVRRPSG